MSVAEDVERAREQCEELNKQTEMQIQRAERLAALLKKIGGEAPRMYNGLILLL
jgi:hypothetical protein